MTQKPSADFEAPISLRQQRLWLLNRIDAGHSVNQSTWLFRIRGPLHVERFQRALGEVIRSHEILRMIFPESEGQVIGRVVRDTAECEISDLTHLPAEQAEAELRQQSLAFAQNRYDATRGPLYRARLFLLSGGSYGFAWGAHHLVFDRPSLAGFTRDLASAYRREPIEGGERFGDFTEREIALLQSEESHSQIEFWKQELAFPLPALQLPLDRPRPAMQTFVGDALDLRLPEGLADKLRALSVSASCSIGTVLLAAYSALLYRHGGQKDFAIGLPNPPRPGPVIGPATGTTVFRADLRGAPDFRTLLERTISTLDRVRTRRDTPIERIVDELNPERNLSHHALYQTYFGNYEGDPVTLALDDVASDAAIPLENATPFDLSVSVEYPGREIRISFQYSRDLFDASIIERMLEHYRTMLEGIAADPGQTIDRIPILTTREENELVHVWNATADDDYSGLLLHQRFEEQAARTPSAIAAILGQNELTYAELNRRANQVAHRLHAQGIGPGARVGISMQRSFEMLTAILGALKAGAGYVPLDPVLPFERLGSMISDARLAIILTENRLVETLAPHGASLLALDDPQGAPQPAWDENLPAAPFSDSVVYITYTSGSTGQPKGIVMTQRPLLNLLGWMLRTTTHLPPQARTLQFASLSFDVSFQDIFATWLGGGTLVLITEAERKDLAGLSRLLDLHGVHRIFLPAVALQQLAEGFCEGNFPCRELRLVVSAGEQLVITEAVRKMFKALPDCRLQNEYGPSETHVVTALALDADPAQWAARPAIGRPIVNSQIYILDPSGNPAPIGVPGELHIGGAGLAQGYIGRDDLTAEKFISDPFSKRPGARLYRTGDQARWLPEGIIEFIGRLDHQIKIRGYRVEPAEIESALEKHPFVREACVIASDFGPSDKRLVAYLALDPDRAPGVNEIRTFLAGKLPDYMIPSSFVMLAALPLNANGKVDRKALPAPEFTRPALDADYTAPVTGLEQVIATLWQEVLRLDKAGIRDNFFDLGGNSVMIVRIHHRLKQHLERDFPLIALFQYPTIDTLAQFLDKNGGAPSTAPQEGILNRAAKQREALSRNRAQFAARPR